MAGPSSFLRHNLLYKLISLVLAFIVWIIVVNISNPEVTSSVTIALEVLHPEVLAEADQAYEIDVRSVKVSYHVRSNYERSVKAQHFSAYVDLYDYSVTGAVPIYVDVDESVTAYVSELSVSPQVAHVTTEDIIERDFTPEYELLGECAEGSLVESVSQAQSIRVRGPRSHVDKISRAVVYVDVSGVSESFSSSSPIELLDQSGSKIEDEELELGRQEASYEVTVYVRRSLPVRVSYTGTPASGYVLSSVNISPESVTVVGEKDAVSGLGSVSIPASMVDISGAGSNFTLSIDISSLLPDGVYTEGESSILVRVYIAREISDEIVIEPETEPETEPESEHEVIVEPETPPQPDEHRPPETPPTESETEEEMPETEATESETEPESVSESAS